MLTGAEVPAPPVGMEATAGSLAGDTTWLAELRRTIARRNQADGPEQVHVLWAGEIDAQRLAVTVAPDIDRDGHTGEMSWQLAAWQISEDGREVSQAPPGATLAPGEDVRSVPLRIDVPNSLDARVPQRFAVLVVGGTARSVDTAGPGRFSASGTRERTFTPLTREGMVWHTVMTEDDFVLGLLRVTAPDGTRRALGSTWSPGRDRRLRPVVRGRRAAGSRHGSAEVRVRRLDGGDSPPGPSPSWPAPRARSTPAGRWGS
jgi:hypothetical protein